MQLVIVDRHGVINPESDRPVTPDHEWRAIPGSLEALTRLSGAGYRLVLASNEPHLHRKNFDVESLISIHHRMQHDLLEAGTGLDAVFFCGCPPKRGCDCMMPKPGMLQEIAERLRTSLEGVPVIGARTETIEAARAAGARPILIGSGAGSKGGSEVPDDLERYDDLAAAVDSLLAESAQT